MRLAELCQERGKHAAAIAALERLYELEGDDPAIANRLGAGYITTGDTKKAAEHFRKLLNETPDNYYAKAHLGFLLFRDKKYEEALPLLIEGIRRDASIQRNGRFYLYAGEALTRLNRSDEARLLNPSPHSLFLAFLVSINYMYLPSHFRHMCCTARRWLRTSFLLSTSGRCSMSPA